MKPCLLHQFEFRLSEDCGRLGDSSQSVICPIKGGQNTWAVIRGNIWLVPKTCESNHSDSSRSAVLTSDLAPNLYDP